MFIEPHLRQQFPATPEPLTALRGAQVAFQPIVNCATLRTYGVEALARLPSDSGFSDLPALMDRAAERGELRLSERLLLTRSIGQFAKISDATAIRLFCNIDNRVFDDPESRPADVVHIAIQKGLSPANLCIELSERQPPESIDAMRQLVNQFMRFNVRIAIDDFGRGFSGLDMLLQVNPHYLKIDRSFISGLGDTVRKQAIVHKVTGLAHSLGLQVVAEGVETEADLRMVRELGCDLCQGFLIARPTTDVSKIKMHYPGTVSATYPREIPSHIADLIQTIEPITLPASLLEATHRFKSRSVKGILPVVDRHGYLLGAIYEGDLSNFLFGEYGSALLANKGLDQSITRVLRPCPISEIHVCPEALVESYVVSDGNEGLLLTSEGRYVGCLSNNAVLRLALSRELEAARDQNPLTRLPGSWSIRREVESLLKRGAGGLLAYFDFDNFKAFNDKYGFAAGDKALLLFADLLRGRCRFHGIFAAHIGGDDFFISSIGHEKAQRALVEELCDTFTKTVINLYSAEDRAAGGFVAEDRFGEQRFFPTLRASAVVLEVKGPDSLASASASAVLDCFTRGKAAAKKSARGIVEIEL